MKLHDNDIPDSEPLKSLKPFVDRTLLEQEKSSKVGFKRNSSALTYIPIVLKCSILQALYSIKDSRALFDQYEYNLLFQWFLGIDKFDESFSATDYKNIQHVLAERHSLRLFLSSVIDKIDKTTTPSQLIVIHKIKNWIDSKCPSEIFFTEFKNSPIEEFQLELIFKEDSPQISPDAFYEFGRERFPYRHVEKLEDGIEGPITFENDDGYQVEFSYNTISIKKQSPYKNWESFSRTIDQVVKICSNINNKCTFGISLSAFNKLQFEEDIVNPSEYLNFIPDSPAPLPIPQFMQETALCYTFPTLNSGYDSKATLYYENEPITLTIEMTASRDLLSSKNYNSNLCLNLTVARDRKTKLADVSKIANNLKNKEFTAFHTLITDKTRELCSQAINE